MLIITRIIFVHGKRQNIPHCLKSFKVNSKMIADWTGIEVKNND
jgi:hypothetical protein